MANITMAIDNELLKKVRKIAIEKDTTLNQIIREYLESLARSRDYSKNALIQELKKHYNKTAFEFDTIKKWKRDELHER